MKNKIYWLVVSSLMVLSLLAASCTPETSANPTGTTAPTSAPTATSAPTGIQTGETTAPATTTGPEMVKVSLKKLDGTTVETTVEKPQYGGTLTLVTTTGPYDFDEAYTSTPWGAEGYLSLTHNELLLGDYMRGPVGTNEVTWSLSGWFDVNYWKGGLAESWEIQPPDTITYKIRQGVHYALNPASEASRLAAGRELTTDDIVYNIKRVFMEIKTAGIYGVAATDRPTDVYAADQNTVVVKAPPGQIWMTFEHVSDWMEIFNPEVIKKYGSAKEWQNSVGTGPFYITDYVPMSAITYARNPNYWEKDPMFPENQLPYFDGIKYLIISDWSTQMSALRTGKIDRLSAVLWEDAASLNKTNPELKSSKALSGSRTLIGMRQDKPDLPFKDVNVRRALMMAINHNQIKDTYYGGQAEVVGYPVTVVKEWSRAFVSKEEMGLASDGFDTKTIYEYNPDEARKLLAAAGYPSGFKAQIAVSGATQSSVDLATMIKDYWAKIGVDLLIDVKEAGVHKTLQNRKTFNEMLLYGYAITGLPHNMDVNRVGNNYNMSMAYDPEIERRYEKMASLQPRTDEWWDVVKDNSRYVGHRVDYVMPPHPYSWVFWQPWLKRYEGALSTGVWNTNIWATYAWLDQDLKKSLGH